MHSVFFFSFSQFSILRLLPYLSLEVAFPQGSFIDHHCSLFNFLSSLQSFLCLSKPTTASFAHHRLVYLWRPLILRVPHILRLCQEVLPWASWHLEHRAPGIYHSDVVAFLCVCLFPWTVHVTGRLLQWLPDFPKTMGIPCFASSLQM